MLAPSALSQARGGLTLAAERLKAPLGAHDDESPMVEDCECVVVVTVASQENPSPRWVNRPYGLALCIHHDVVNSAVMSSAAVEREAAPIVFELQRYRAPRGSILPEPLGESLVVKTVGRRARPPLLSKGGVPVPRTYIGDSLGEELA